MQVTLLPSAFSPAGEQRQFLTSYLVNDTLAIDAGSLGLVASVAEQARVKHVLLSHSHLDHLASLPLFLDNVRGAPGECVTVHASEAVLHCLRHDVFNNRLWPDFIGLSAAGEPFLKLEALEPGETVRLGGLHVTPVPVDHAVPTFGFILEDAAAAVVIASDTGPTEALWDRASRTPNLKAVFLEASLPDSQARLARLAGHLTPATFAAEVRKLKQQVAWLAVHIKAEFFDQVVQELQALGLPDLAVAQFGKPYHW